MFIIVSVSIRSVSVVCAPASLVSTYSMCYQSMFMFIDVLFQRNFAASSVVTLATLIRFLKVFYDFFFSFKNFSPCLISAEGWGWFLCLTSSRLGAFLIFEVCYYTFLFTGKTDIKLDIQLLGEIQALCKQGGFHHVWSGIRHFHQIILINTKCFVAMSDQTSSFDLLYYIH